MRQAWLVTGSSRGLGRAFAEAVLEAGHNLVATARAPEQLADLAECFPETMATTALDVTDPEAAARAVALTLAALAAPPLRLVLGSDAFERATMLHRARMDELHRWQDLSAPRISRRRRP